MTGCSSGASQSMPRRERATTNCGRLTVNERLGLAVVLFWVGQVLAYPFVFGFEPYYDVYVDQPERLFGLSPLTDQKLAGVVMMVEQALTLAVALVLLVRAARRSRRPNARRIETAEI